MPQKKIISVIPAKSDFLPGQGQTHRKQRVAAYCRVSTDQEDQESSYEAQIAYYHGRITSNPEWEFAGIFADKGLSGISAKKRPQFLKLMQLCKDGKIDMVLTKSISRFSRNTLDCIRYIRMLKDKGIPVVFEKENINTMDPTSEMMLSILGSFAQAEK